MPTKIFTKRQPTVEGIQYVGSNFEEIKAWIPEAEERTSKEGKYLIIPTRKGPMRVSLKDFIFDPGTGKKEIMSEKDFVAHYLPPPDMMPPALKAELAKSQM